MAMFISKSAIDALQEAVDGFANVSIETKVVRHVRTPAGVARFKLPIGSVIVGHDHHLPNVRETPSDYQGWNKYDTGKGNFYVGKEDGKWIVTDPNDNDLHTTSSEESALKWLNNHTAPKKATAQPKPKTTHTASSSSASGGNKLPVGSKVTTPDGKGTVKGHVARSGKVLVQDHATGKVKAHEPHLVTTGNNSPVAAPTAAEDLHKMSEPRLNAHSANVTSEEDRRRVQDEKNRRAWEQQAKQPEGHQRDEQAAAAARAKAKREARQNANNNAKAPTQVSKAPATPRTVTSTPSTPKAATAPATTPGGEHLPTYQRPQNLSTAKNARPGVLTPSESDYEGWDKYSDGHVSRYLGKQDGLWTVTDENDKVLLTGTNKAKVIKEMNVQHQTFDDGSPVKKFPRAVSSGPHAAPPRGTTVKDNNLVPAESEQQIRAHTEQYGYTIPRDAKNVMLNANPSDPNSTLLAWYRQDKDGKAQIRQKAETVTTNEQKKWDRIRSFDDDVRSVDSAIDRADLSRDDDMAVIALMRRYGARIGSNKVDGGKDDDEPRGISELRPKDVKVEGNKLVIDYPGKKYNSQTGAGWQHYEISDPQLVKAIKDRMNRAESPEESLFPNATAATTMARSRSITNGEYTNHDFRRKFATDQAMAMVRSWKPQPKNATEANQAMQEIAAEVDKMLNDKKQALKSYIDPRTFSAWNKLGD